MNHETRGTLSGSSPFSQSSDTLLIKVLQQDILAHLKGVMVNITMRVTTVKAGHNKRTETHYYNIR